MTANAGKGSGQQSGADSTGSGAKGGKPRKRTSAAKPPSDEVTIKTPGGTSGDAADSTDPADQTVVDLPAKTDAAEETVHDLDVRRPAGDSSGASKDAAGESPKSGDPSSSPGSTQAMDAPTHASGFGTASTSGGAPPHSAGRPPAIGPASSARAEIARKPDKSQAARKTPRKAHLQVARFEPWSVMKFSFIMSLVCFLVLFVAVAVLYALLSALGVFDALSDTIRDLANDQDNSGGINPASWFSAPRILGYTALIGTLNVLLITALATVWSVIYNMAADLVGGVEVTLKEAEQ